jgi:class 3 adenylate cyclase
MASKSSNRKRRVGSTNPSTSKMKTPATFRTALSEAEGRSEFVIAVFADIRGFSKFSKIHESPDIAMLIKRFYLQLIDEYFDSATFFKPTGDGLMIIYTYNERTLDSVAAEVLNATVRCMEDFPAMLSGDPMINFETPENLGFGIARGTACRLHSGRMTIDYSGHLINLSARLMELAQPSGIVIDSAFGEALIPDAHRDRFDNAAVYIRSLAETHPVTVFFLADSVKLSPDALQPLQGKRWKTHKREFKVADLRKIGQYFLIELPDIADKLEPLIVTLRYPMMRNGRVLKGYCTNQNFEVFIVKTDHVVTKVRVDFFAVADILENERVPRTRFVTFKIDYVAAGP